MCTEGLAERARAHVGKVGGADIFIYIKIKVYYVYMRELFALLYMMCVVLCGRFMLKQQQRVHINGKFLFGFEIPGAPPSFILYEENISVI